MYIYNESQKIYFYQKKKKELESWPSPSDPLDREFS